MPPQQPLWTPELGDRRKPAYLAIAEAIEEDIRSGRLASGQRLPPQRQLAHRLGLDFTTVSRAYSEAQRRGLIDGRVGQGTFVRADATATWSRAGSHHAGRFVDMMMNQPPIPTDPALLDRLRKASIAALPSNFHAWLRYPGPHDLEAAREAGARWLEGRLPGISSERIQVTPGTQGALLALLTKLARPGDPVLTEALTYPGFKAIAAQLGLRLIAVPMDTEGLDPEALERACLEHRPKALYCTPTLHNPTTAVMPLERRQAVADIAQAHGVPVLEDDIYGPLPERGPPPIAALAPELTYYIAGLAKCVSPALRIAYVVAPDAYQAERVLAAQRSMTLMASPLATAVATQWISDGTAAAVLSAIRREAIARQRSVAKILPPEYVASKPEAFHFWLRLPESWTRGEFAAYLHGRGIAAATSDTFAVTPTVPEAVRICLGAAADRTEAEWVIETLAQALNQTRPLAAGVI